MSDSDGLMGKYFSLHSSLRTSLLQVIGLALVVSMATVADAKSPKDGKMVEAGIRPKPKARSVEQIDANSFCENISDLASEQRYAWQLQNLIALQSDIDERLEKLEALRADVKDWIAKRDKVLSDVKEHIILVYERMRPEAAAERLAAVDDEVAIALLAKMKPRVVSAILNEMDAAKASDLTQEMASLVEIKSGERDQ
ncbi:MotE family protein [uncultured Cohaesibacter sp.]|uniref:MotE family protein n=1 Tax=uncultured Cohaesibacter sp. TaxID=1002546 RepID=UPI002AA79528|nr:MotE family protein [uncultured Cohaesibacter sp.]